MHLIWGTWAWQCLFKNHIASLRWWIVVEIILSKRLHLLTLDEVWVLDVQRLRKVGFFPPCPCEYTLLEASLKPVGNGVMHDLCTRPDPSEPPQHGSPMPEMSRGEPESPAGPGHPDREKPELASDVLSGMNLGSSTTNENGSVTVPPTVLGKRHHSLYEGLNGCEAGGFGKVRFSKNTVSVCKYSCIFAAQS